MLQNVENINHLIELTAKIIEGIAVIVIAVSLVYAAIRYIKPASHDLHATRTRYEAFRARLGHGLLVGLEILVAGDIIRTVALEPTLNNVIALGVLVVVRVILGWSIAVEIEGHWPWQKHGLKSRE